MMSVIRNTNGHSSTPLVNDSEPLWPNRFQLSVCRPSVGSSANIFTPTNSAISALTARNADSTTNNCVVLEPSGLAGETDMRQALFDTSAAPEHAGAVGSMHDRRASAQAEADPHWRWSGARDAIAAAGYTAPHLSGHVRSA